MDRHEYTSTKLTVQDLEGEVDNLWNQLQTEGSALRREAVAEGIDLSKVDGLGRQEAISIKREGDGMDPVTTAIVIAFAPVAAKITGDLWTHILLPRIKERFGAGSLVGGSNGD